jgi:hypothetical protein
MLYTYVLGYGIAYCVRYRCLVKSYFVKKTKNNSAFPQNFSETDNMKMPTKYLLYLMGMFLNRQSALLWVLVYTDLITDTATFALYHDLHLEIDNEALLNTKLYDKRDNINFPIVLSICM